MQNENERTINATAPIRVCDNGGWTDTWFGGRGCVFNIAVAPRVHVQLKVSEAGNGARDDKGKPVAAIDIDDCLNVPIGSEETDPLITAAISYASLRHDLCLDVCVRSDVPAGCSTGTSAAVAVALLAALGRVNDQELTPHDLAMAAYHVEANVLGRECGIQDQLAAAYGGVNLIDVDRFPTATVHPMELSDSVRWELEVRLVLVFVGKSHNSSDVHKEVITRLTNSKGSDGILNDLRSAANRSADAVRRGDLESLGRAMRENTEAQAALHPMLVGEAHQRVIDIAAAHGAMGWKVNGAGGDGGSVTLLGPADVRQGQRLIAALDSAGDGVRVIPTSLSLDGVRCWQSVGVSSDSDRLGISRNASVEV